MKKTFTLLSLLFISFFSIAQTQLVKGRLLADDGSPLPGVNVTVKGTTTGTVTDVDGNYEIQAPTGAILVFSFVGMETRELLVTPGMTTSEPVKPLYTPEEKKTLDAFIPEAEDTIGVAVLRKNSPTYKAGNSLIPRQIRRIKQLSADKFRIQSFRDAQVSEEMKFQFTTRYGFKTANSLPALQNRYSQGIPQDGAPVWTGPDQGTPFSWGPSMNLLEFDGSDYAWDKNGRLMMRDGTGLPALTYDNNQFLQTAQSYGNEFILDAPIAVGGILMVSLKHDKEQFLIRGGDRNTFQTTVKATNIQAGSWEFGGNAGYRRIAGSLWPHGASLARVMAGMLTAPVSFDLANGLSAYRAARSAESYLLSPGIERTFSDNFSNPYGLIRELPDQDRHQQITGRVNILKDFLNEDYTHTLQGSLSIYGEKDRLNSEFGVPELYTSPGRNTQRIVDQLNAGGELSLQYRYHDHPVSLEVIGKYLPGIRHINLDRTDRWGLTGTESDSMLLVNQSIRRMVHEGNLEASLQLRWLDLHVGNLFYASSTAPFYGFLPNAGIELNIGRLLQAYLGGPDIGVFYNFSRNVREGRLLQTDWSYASLGKPVSRFQEVYESGEVFFQDDLDPEMHIQSELGMNVSLYNFHSTFRLFRQVTEDFITFDPYQSRLINAGEELRTGLELEASYQFYGQGTSLGMTFSTWDSEIRKLNTAYSIPVAGFESAVAMLSEGDPAGTLYGTSYERDTEGRRLIGPDGFPVRSTELRRLASPVPDWRIGLNSTVRLGRFTIQAAVLAQRGGKMWNGTRAYLDYLGRSEQSGELRYVSRYVFDGVTENGLPNNTPVSFYNPDLPLGENRWVRYGPEGVAEDYIEDTSWIRIQDISVKYTLRNLSVRYLDEIDLIAGAGNILLYSAYDGVDPESSLFSYSKGAGLDLFNLPAATQFTAQVIVKF